MTICHQKIETHEENQYVHVYQTVYLSTSVSTVVTSHVYPLCEPYNHLFIKQINKILISKIKFNSVSIYRPYTGYYSVYFSLKYPDVSTR